MLRSYKYRLYPTKKQEELINKSIGACRFVYNLALETRSYAYNNYGINVSGYDLMKQLTDLKKDHVWLKEVDSQALTQSIANLERGYINFFRGRGKYPCFKSKSRSTQSFTNYHGSTLRIIGSRVSIPKFRDGIKFKDERKISGDIKCFTISKIPSGKYFISITADTKQTPTQIKEIAPKSAIGIDLGIKSFIVTSDGLQIDNPKHLKKSERHLKYLQRQASRKKKGGANKRKAVYKFALCHEKIVNQRKDFLHKLSTELINNHDTLCFESLNIAGLKANHKLAQSISDLSWGVFIGLCKYKAKWNGKNVLQIPTFEPSTKICNQCESVNDTLTLKDREWVCAGCGTIHDRDINAAINIKNYCMKNFSGEAHRKKPVELPAIVGAVKQEINTLYAELPPLGVALSAGIEYLNGQWRLKD